MQCLLWTKISKVYHILQAYKIVNLLDNRHKILFFRDDFTLSKKCIYGRHLISFKSKLGFMFINVLICQNKFE